MRIPIRAKLTAALAVPMVALVGGAAYEVDEAERRRRRGRRRDRARRRRRRPRQPRQPAPERAQLVGRRPDRHARADRPCRWRRSQEARANTDAAWASSRLRRPQRPDVQTPLRRTALAAMAGLGRRSAPTSTRRRSSTGSTTPPSPTRSSIGTPSIIGVLLDGTRGIALQIDDAELRTGVELVDLATRLYELRAQHRSGTSCLPLLTGTSGSRPRSPSASCVAVIEDIDQELLAAVRRALRRHPRVRPRRRAHASGRTSCSPSSPTPATSTSSPWPRSLVAGRPRASSHADAGRRPPAGRGRRRRRRCRRAAPRRRRRSAPASSSSPSS